MSVYWKKIIRPVLFRIDAERAHEMGMIALKSGLAGSIFSTDAGAYGLETEAFGLKFKNPLGLAAGFDKNGRAVGPLAHLGFGSIEVGTVTDRPQPGNPKPRVFRLPEDRALINRLGFNNDGAAALVEALANTDSGSAVVGVNIGKNRDVPVEEAVENYLACLGKVHPAADYIAVNISSPNTPGLRDLQNEKEFDRLMAALAARNKELGGKPLLVKIAPDLSEGELAAILDVCVELAISGIIATNTTISRDGLVSRNAADLGNGGLSGRPLAERSDRIISKIYRHTNGKLQVIGVGGVFSAEDAFQKIAAGASIVQAYTGFVYGGPTFPRTILSGLEDILHREGFDSVTAAVGSRAE